MREAGWFSVDDQLPRAGIVQPGWFRQLQALEDAIAYRRARVTAPCSDCQAAAPGLQCDDHACDMHLIAGYQQAASVVCGWIGARNAEIAKAALRR
jgi:hypothetical protein